ncbi:outer membrane beta-barrel protein [Sphingomonas sp. MAH-20]|uniref:Outer membrane beta-barrel protein n=1 Tax=Sphingomonas horti TaxID=2682842 RepID=A0A6I4IZ64_9SPHN|nr:MULTISPECIES: OmpW family outer membrane protein [Sphingomonas]MBA2920458.1 OmpW family protein [Sphingomonas sp. CGMCC 1.13658]MVO76711.1 outer membrane beta-barrel protein [Sphingomonas horti]
MKYRVTTLAGVCLAGLIVSAPAMAQDQGDAFVRVGAARTKLVDKGTISINGAVDPNADYKTRDTFHGVLTGGYFVFDRVALEASISTPATTNNMPAGSLAGTPNLGDDEFAMLTVGASLHPFKGRVSPYIGGGYMRQFTTQERDALAVGLDIPNAGGPYVQAGVDVAVSDRWGVFAEVRKGFYHTNATGRLPLDATFTNFAAVEAKAELDPLTIQVGLTARFGHGADAGSSQPIATDDAKWVLKAGLTNLSLADKVKLSVGGAPYPGAGLSTFEHHTVSVQIGRFLTPNIAINATLGLPPSIDVFGAGSIGALPKLGEVTYGPTMLTLQYHPTRSGRIRPYIGAGVSYMIVFDTKDGAFQKLRVDNDLGPAFEAGADIMVNDRWGIFADAKKAFLRPKAFGTFQGLAVEGKTKLDPWAFSGGVSFHF